MVFLHVAAIPWQQHLNWSNIKLSLPVHDMIRQTCWIQLWFVRIRTWYPFKLIFSTALISNLQQHCSSRLNPDELKSRISLSLYLPCSALVSKISALDINISWLCQRLSPYWPLFILSQYLKVLIIPILCSRISILRYGSAPGFSPRKSGFAAFRGQNRWKPRIHSRPQERR